MCPKLLATLEPALIVGDHPWFPTGAHPRAGLSPPSLAGAHPTASILRCRVGQPVLGSARAAAVGCQPRRMLTNKVGH